MTDENTTNKPIAAFAFGIKTWKESDTTKTTVHAVNTGIPNGDVLFILETWLEKTKSEYKNRISELFQ
ncbi:hypothetical protein HY484_04810 [Candidatus Woesearchaeota archaeon]|nr:hypothetical protein [Candidatus Woesearchaeota archaeon]